MSYLVDSDIVVDWLQQQAPAVALLSALAPDGIAISLISYGEIYEGVYFGRDPQRSEQVFEQFLSAVAVLPLNRLIMQRFARLRGTLRQQGISLSDPDLLIAATAIDHDLVLVTGNARHFERIPGLKLHA
jgi:tRNA(fMet)-specific endonuclease VapC